MNKRLLLVDDNKEIVEIITVVLNDLFESIDAAYTVGEALKALSEKTYDLVYLDINIANRNGAEVVKFLIESLGNPNQNVPFVIMSGLITPSFVDRYQKRFAGILMKPFETDDVRRMSEEILGLRGVPKNKPIAEATLEEIPHLKCDLPFPLVQFEQRVSKILEQVRKSAKLNQLFSSFKIDRSENNYILTHIGMLINISAAICIQMEWDSDTTLEKFVYAAYLHDMALVHRPDLVRIATLEELESLRGVISEVDYHLILEHPNIAANSINDFSEIPPDVEIIIRQHHELPKRSGFPTKCGYQKIAPFAAVFIVAHNLTDYILTNPNWNPAGIRRSLDEYIEKSEGQLQGSHFTKIFRSLSFINRSK